MPRRASLRAAIGVANTSHGRFGRVMSAQGPARARTGPPPAPVPPPGSLAAAPGCGSPASVRRCVPCRLLGARVLGCSAPDVGDHILRDVTHRVEGLLAGVAVEPHLHVVDADLAVL